jgi:DNA-binding NarL/FixJ family response regulator
MANAKTPSKAAPAGRRTHPHSTAGVSVCLVGGTRIVRRGIELIFEQRDIVVGHKLPNDEDLAERLNGVGSTGCDVLVLIVTAGPFAAFHQLRRTLSQAKSNRPLVVLAERATRGQVYSALRIGAKGYVAFDADPEELVRAVRAAAQGKAYLAPDVAELLVSDVSSAVQPGGNARLAGAELSRREVEIVQLLCEGLSSKEVARKLHLSAKTVENHRYNIYRKCEVDSIAALMRHAIRHGLVAV